MANKGNHKKRTKINLSLDIALVVAFIVSLRPFLTGLAVHEWLGLAIGGVLGVHLARHWKWVVGVTKVLLGRLPSRTRVYYVLDLALLVLFGAIIGSGVAMSRAVLPSLGVYGSTGAALAALHKLSSYLTLILLGAKLVLHRKWFVSAIGRRERGWPHVVQRQRGKVLQGYEQGR